jgi:hypothetical protein
MGGETPIGHCDKLFVEPFLTPAGFVTGDEQDRFTLRIESEGGAPLAICRLEPQLLHIGVLRPFERICVWAAELRAIVGKQPSNGEQRVLDTLVECEKLRLEGILEFNLSSHRYSFQAM